MSLKVSLLAATIILSVLTAGAQAIPGAEQESPASESARPSRAADNSDTGGSGNETSQWVLEPAQIRSILEENPEAVVEVKALVADALRQKGLAVQADAITDEQLYTQIA